MATPIQYQSALDGLVKDLVGTKTSENQGTTSTANTGSTATQAAQTTADPAAIAALQTLLAQQQAAATPEGSAAQINQIFTQGAQQIPALTQAFANAVGSRSSNNSGLQLALGDLNTDLATKAAGVVSANQAAAAGTAAQLANATKGSTATTSQTGTTANTGTTTSAKSTGANTGNAALLAGLGTAANAADKLGFTKYLKDLVGGSGDGTGGSGGFTLDLSNSFGGGNLGLEAPAAFSLDPLQLRAEYGPDLSAALGTAGSAAGGLAGNTTDLFNLDLSGLLGDVGTGASDLFSGIGDSVSSGVGGAIDAIGSWFDDAGSWFADGGHVNVAKIRAGNEARMASVPAKAPGYADGGPVTRNKNNMGSLATAPGTGALNASPEQIAALTAPTPTTAAMTAPAKFVDTRGERPADQLTSQLGGGAEGNGPTTGGPGGTPEQNAAMANAFGMSLATALATAALGPVGALGMKGISALTGTPTLPGAMMQQVVASITGSGAGDNGSMGDRGPGGSSGDSAAAAAGADAAGPGGHGGTAGSGTGSGVGGGDAGSSADGSYRDGGHINGPGTGTSDSIIARLSDGEFVISKDVVDAVGTDFLQKLQDTFHTPAAMQKLQRA